MIFGDEPYYKMVFYAAGINAITRRWTERRIRPLGMTYAQFGALMALNRNNGITQKKLADLMDTDTTTVMVLCDSLEKKAWLNREPDASDRRVNRLVLTDEGISLYQQALARIRTGFEYMLERTSSEELKKVLPFLEKVYGELKTLMETEKR
jgi:MarR family transcriptional regulator, transcriptional regulator for hemolysin